MVGSAVLDRPAAAAGPVHATLLRPLLGSGRAEYETGMVLSAIEQSFIDALLADLAAPDWHDQLTARLPARFGADSVAELSQPIHRRFYLVLLEAVCDTPGAPRLDPAKIVSMGLVLRRGATDGAAGPPWQGWMNDGRRKLGWMALPGPTTVESARGLEPDPDPALRPRRPRLGVAALEAKLAEADPPLPAEDVLPLFLAPEDLCRSLRRTVLFGLVPVASSELSEATRPAPDYVAEAQSDGGVLIGHLSGYLKARPATVLPRAGEVLDKSWLDLPADSAPDSDAGRMLAFGLLLQQLTAECDAFGGGTAAQSLLSQLAQISLPTAWDAYGSVIASITADKFLPQAAAILAGGDDNPAGVTMPQVWPAVDDTLGTQLTQAALSCLSARFAQLRPNVGKFDGLTRQYAVRAFVRVQREPACPPHPVWSGWSMPFRILPWWDGDGPPAQIPLPDLSDRGVLKAMKPGVAFQVPPALANLLQADPKKLRDGDASGGGKLTIAWLCSFSIPIITICAFIVLNIFLSLFDLFLRWMMFIKICIPIPKRGGD